VLDENREKMSSSKGNVVDPADVVGEFPVDAIRYWAASSAVGDDFPYLEKDIVAGEKLLRKLWNASKLVDQLTPDEVSELDELDPIDEWLLAELDAVVAEATEQFREYEFAKARDNLRTFFWNTFCDDYLEIAKNRETESTAYALRTAHRTFCQLFAPLLPHVTEELWDVMYDGGSVHRTDWPEPRGYEADLDAGETAMEVVSALRKYKTEHQLALNEELDAVSVYGNVSGMEDAVAEVMHVQDLEVLDEEPETTTEITNVDLDYSTVGPQYGEMVGEIDAGIESGEFKIEDDRLLVAGEELGPDLFEIERERTYSGEGEMVETDSAIVIVRN
jgi:valyl-tRNA synthetase